MKKVSIQYFQILKVGGLLNAQAFSVTTNPFQKGSTSGGKPARKWARPTHLVLNIDIISRAVTACSF